MFPARARPSPLRQERATRFASSQSLRSRQPHPLPSGVRRMQAPQRPCIARCLGCFHQ